MSKYFFQKKLIFLISFLAIQVISCEARFGTAGLNVSFSFNYNIIHGLNVGLKTRSMSVNHRLFFLFLLLLYVLAYKSRIFMIF